MAKKKHHYVPEFYLARFSCEGVKGGKIFSYSKKRHSLLETNTHDVCEKNKFYSILDSTSFDELALEDNFFAFHVLPLFEDIYTRPSPSFSVHIARVLGAI